MSLVYALSDKLPTAVVTFIFDGSFEAWLTAVFEVYEYRLTHQSVLIVAQHDCVPDFLSQTIVVEVCEDKAKRVFKKIKKILPIQAVVWAFLSEDKDIYTHLFYVIKEQLLLSYSNKSILDNYANSHARAVNEAVKKTRRERHRMQAFVRFSHTTQGVYFAKVNPDFNVLPLLGSFFANRFADQSWVIFDVVRGYGIFYDKDSPKLGVREIVGVDEVLLEYGAEKNWQSENEPFYQQLWQAYFSNVTIQERQNMKHHVAQLPKRYWRYLTEKQGK